MNYCYDFLYLKLHTIVKVALGRDIIDFTKQFYEALMEKKYQEDRLRLTSPFLLVKMIRTV